ncbi:hypothetical protein JFT44_12285 [Pseudomonas sp. MF5691]|uniref:hypothetical protein n=1 Tax=Pseudomonas sp. MF5691 TaxID=2797526 RepID=UPI0018E82CDE|nr:hypothetical protein [Pseudomonas sp. MF5691]MBJ2290713.1 hypothetical protein [Pseudomonas sp. MF5691]
MTTNQTIDGVSRAALEILLSGKGGLAQAAAAHELRAMLDANPEENVPCPECGGSLVTWGCNCTPRWPMYKPAAQPQGEPVADAPSTGFYTTETGGGKYAINIGFRSMADMQAADAQLRELLKSR